MSLSLNLNGGKKPLLNNIVVENGYPEFPKVSSGPDGSGLTSPLIPSSGVTIGDKHHMDEIIPTRHSNRTIILCFDGTGDQFDEDVRINLLKRNIPSLLVPIFQELQYRSVLLHAEKGQQIRTDGLLSGVPFDLNSIRSSNHILCSLAGWYWNVYHTGNCDSFHGEGFKDTGYDARQSSGCTYYG
jgi:hypothetical protein